MQGDGDATESGLPDLSGTLHVDAALAAPFAVARYGIRAGELPLLVDPVAGTQIVDMPKLFPLPNSEHWCHGLANVYGTLVPIFDLAEAVGNAAPSAGERMLLVMGERERAAALIIDGAPVRLDLDPETEVRPGELPPLLEPHVKTAYRLEGTQWLDVQYPTLFRDLSRMASVRA